MNKEEMEKNNPLPLEKSILLNKSSSFSTNEHRPQSRPLRRALTCVDEARNHDVSGDDHQPTLDQISQEIEGLLSSMEDKSDLKEIPQSIEIFANMVQSEIDKYDDSIKFGQDSEQDSLVMNAVSKVSKLINLLEQFSMSDKVKPSLTLMILVLQRAMSMMEDDLRILLEDSMNQEKNTKSEEVDEEEKQESEVYPGMRQDTMTSMKMIASSMVSSGYGTECELVYTALRRSAMKKVIKQQGLENISMDDMQKMQWEALQAHITTWVNVIKHLGEVVLPGEKHLCNFVFSYPSSMAEDMITELASSVVILCLNFAEAIAMTKRSAERLLPVLCVHEALTELRLGTSISDELKQISHLYSDDLGKQLYVSLAILKIQ